MRKAQRIPRNRDVDLDELELFHESRTHLFLQQMVKKNNLL
jgi:hypothetical protein